MRTCLQPSSSSSSSSSFQAVGVFPTKDKKGVLLQIRRKGKTRKPSKMYAQVKLIKTNRKIYRSIRKFLGNQKYRPDLVEVWTCGTITYLNRNTSLSPSLPPLPLLLSLSSVCCSPCKCHLEDSKTEQEGSSSSSGCLVEEMITVLDNGFIEGECGHHTKI